MNRIERKGDEVQITMPVSEVHKLCTALEPCACRMNKAAGSEGIRQRLKRGLSRIIAKK